MIKRSNLDPSLIQWIQTQTGLPYGVGEIFHLVPAASATSQYRTQLQSMGVKSGKMFTTLAAAKAAMVTDRGDTLLVYPGDYVSTASLTWDLDHTNIIGVGSPNQTFQPSTLTAGGVRLKCATAAVAQILNVTGNYFSMYNIGTQNTADNAGNISDIRISARNFLARGCSFRGGTGATQIATADCGVGIFVDTSIAGAGNAMVVENCTIGSSGNTIRTVGAGCLVFGAGTAAGGFEPRFKDCNFSMYSSTAGCYFINAQYNAGFDRFCIFERCMFTNFGSSATILSEAIRNNNDTAWILIKDCGGLGFATWSSTGVKHTYVCNPAGLATGGIGISVA